MRSCILMLMLTRIPALFELEIGEGYQQHRQTITLIDKTRSGSGHVISRYRRIAFGMKVLTRLLINCLLDRSI